VGHQPLLVVGAAGHRLPQALLELPDRPAGLVVPGLHEAPDPGPVALVQEAGVGHAAPDVTADEVGGEQGRLASSGPG
jgi:hypothetical protein